MRKAGCIRKAVCLLVCSAFLAKSYAASFQGLGDLSGGSFFSYALGVSDGGRVVVGVGTSAAGEEAFRWSPDGGMLGLGATVSGGFFNRAAKVSSDGTVVGGSGSSSVGTKAIRWQDGIGAFISDVPGAGQSDVRAVSADGTALAGYVYSPSGVEAFKWSASSGMQLLGDLPGGGFLSDANGISNGGLVVVGGSYSSLSGARPEAFRWHAGTMEPLGDLPGGVFQSAGLAVTPDGAVVVGYAHSAEGSEAVRWTQMTGMVGLGDLPGGSFDSKAYGVSADGSIVVGHATSASGEEAFVWSAGAGMRSLRSVLVTDHGLSDELAGWVLLSAEAISADGTAIAGYGINSQGRVEAFVATIPRPNAPPTALPGPDQTIRAGTTVQLDGSGSFDDNTPSVALGYTWDFVSRPAGSSATLAGASSATPTFVADVSGTYVIQLVVTDGDGLSSTPSLVECSTTNLPPTAAMQPTATVVLVGTPVHLDGSASTDPEGEALRYAWALSSAPAGSEASLATPASVTSTFTPDLEGIYSVTLTVSDPFGPGSPATVTMTATSSVRFAEIQILGASALFLGPAAPRADQRWTSDGSPQFPGAGHYITSVWRPGRGHVKGSAGDPANRWLPTAWLT